MEFSSARIHIHYSIARVSISIIVHEYIIGYTYEIKNNRTKINKYKMYQVTEYSNFHYLLQF